MEICYIKSLIIIDSIKYNITITAFFRILKFPAAQFNCISLINKIIKLYFIKKRMGSNLLCNMSKGYNNPWVEDLLHFLTLESCSEPYEGYIYDDYV